MMDIQDLIAIANIINGRDSGSTAKIDTSPKQVKPVLVCTDKRAVIFGYTGNPHADPISLTDARMCLYWSRDVGGVFGLAEIGPTSGCNISARVDFATFSRVTAVFDITEKAELAWRNAPVQGREE